MSPDELPARRLPPNTEQQLEIAIGAVASIFGLGAMHEDLKDYLMDRIAETLTSTQRRDPQSILSSDVLGRIEADVKGAYGLDRPANLHAAPQGDPRERNAPADDAGGSFFALDAFGLTRQQRQFGGISNEEHSLRSGTALPAGAYRTSYADIDPRAWNPTSGAAGLTASNFASTDFFKAGLDLGTTQSLFSQGFNQTQIVAAATFTKDLGISVKEYAAPVARLKRDIPGVDKGLTETRDNWHEVGDLQREAREARERGDLTRAAELDRQAREKETHAAEHDQDWCDRVRQINPARVGDLTKTQRAIRKANGVSADLRKDRGNEVATDVSLSEIGAAQAPVSGNAADDFRAKVAARLGRRSKLEASTDTDDFGVTAQPKGTAAAHARPTAADDLDDFGVTAQAPASSPQRLASAETAPAEAASIHAGKEKDDKAGIETPRHAGADRAALAEVKLASAQPDGHPGKEKDDKVEAAPDRPTSLASAKPARPLNPTA